MGKKDRERKQLIQTVLVEAWDKWVDGASRWTMSHTQNTAKTMNYSTYDDSEYDPIEMAMEYDPFMEDTENLFEVGTRETFAPTFFDDLNKGISPHNKCTVIMTSTII